MSRKRILSLIFAVAIVVSSIGLNILPVSAAANANVFIAPIGAPDPNAIKIYTAQDLSNIRNNLSGSYVLMNDIYLSGGWKPIGSEETPFTGRIDGQGHIIWGLKNDGSEVSPVMDRNNEPSPNFFRANFSLITSTDSSAEIENIGIKDMAIMFSFNNPTPNVVIDGGNVGTAFFVEASGLVNGNSGKINNCFTEGNISVNVLENGHAVQVDLFSGGICVLNSGTITNCYNSADISLKSAGRGSEGDNRHNASAGGICYLNGAFLTECYNTGNITLNAGRGHAGGICAELNTIYGRSDVARCFNTGNITVISTTESMTQGDQSLPDGSEATANAGGICGGFGNVTDCYNTGNINASANHIDGGQANVRAGGISAGHSNVKNCYSSGDVSSSGSAAYAKKDYNYAETGGIAGYGKDIQGNVLLAKNITSTHNKGLNSCSYFLGKSLFADDYIKANNLALDSIQGNAQNDASRLITLNEAKTQSTYEKLGWDFKDTWKMVEGKDYPQLAWQADSSSTVTAGTLTATPTASMVLVNGKTVAFDAYNINGNNYFKLRDLAHILNGTEKQFEVGWDGANNAISLTRGKPYTAVGGEMTGKGAGVKTPTPTSSKIYLDGKEVSFTAYTIDGNNYFKLRDIGQTFNFGVTWDGANNTIVIDTAESYTAD